MLQAYSVVFMQEISILKSCRDRNIVQFIGACLQPEQTMLVTEFMEGGDLYHAIANDSTGRFSWYRRCAAVSSCKKAFISVHWSS